MPNLETRMRTIGTTLACGLILAAMGCNRPRIPAAAGKGAAGGATDFHGIFSNSVFGASSINISPTICAGRIALQQGSATVADSCFTGDTNVVLCTNVSGLNPVRCTPHEGSLSIYGIGGDEISYARVK
jgi:hypothetical protein